MKTNISLAIALCILLSLPVVHAQRTISGVVSDAATQRALPGVMVEAIGGNTMVKTDKAGKYSLFVPGNSSKLRFTLPGYKKVSKSIRNVTALNVELIERKRASGVFKDSVQCCDNMDFLSAATTTVSNKDFNQGYITDPLLLIQGKVPGVQIYTHGGDPNRASYLRIRGLSAYSESEGPLIVIDGIIGGTLESVDPNDIESIRVLKDGTSASHYGIRGNGGVIEITTKKGVVGENVRWTYNGQFSIDAPVDPIATMNAEAFRAVDGIDFGSSTNWFEEITTSPFSHSHGLAASGGIGKNSVFRISSNLREKGGVLRNTGFDQFNTRLNFSTKALADKLTIDFVTAYTYRDQQNGYTDAFKYATIFNPTIPLKGEDFPYIYNEDQYGGYAETVSLFDSYNPLSIVEQNRNETEKKIFNYRAQLTYEIGKGLRLKVSTARQEYDLANTQYAPPTALYRGNASSATRRGLAEFYESNATLHTYESSINYERVIENVGLDLTAGYFFQEDNFGEQFYSLGDFPNNDLDFDNLIEASQDLLNAGFIGAFSNASPDNRIAAFFGRANLNFKNLLSINFGIRSEGSSKLGENSKWGWFPSLGLGLNLTPYIHIPSVDLLKVRVGQGITGGLPQQYGLSQGRRRLINNPNTGAVDTDVDRIGNDDLKWEEKRELNIGVDLVMGKLSATIDWYDRETVDIINENSNERSNYLPFYDNIVQINARGLDINLQYTLVQNENIGYQTGLVLSSYHQTLEAFNVEKALSGSPSGAGGCCSTYFILSEVGESIGNMWGPVYLGAVDGYPIFDDVNGDGVLVDYWALDPEVDFAILGNGLPDWELGWSNQLRIGDWSVNAFFRGAFGHSLVNEKRLIYEPIPQFWDNKPYNLVNTSKAEEELYLSRYSSLYVEKADFLRLDNLTIARQLNFDRGDLESIQLSLTFQNLFTWTNYTGANPEPRLVDIQGTPFTERGFTIDPLTPGIDRQRSYIPVRSVVFGVRMGF